jgi:ABC-type phosphate transport system permease subunit
MSMAKIGFIGWTLTLFGVIFNILSIIWMYNVWNWIGENPPRGASSGAVGIVLTFMILPLLFSWVVLIYAGKYLREAKIF